MFIKLNSEESFENTNSDNATPPPENNDFNDFSNTDEDKDVESSPSAEGEDG